MSKRDLLLAALLLLKILAFFTVSRDYDFHRDELLYLALGSHPDWGYWSNPPMIGWLGAVTRLFPVYSLDVVRVFPLLASVGTLVLALRITRIMGGGFYAEALAGLAMLLCPPYLRTMAMFQPVVFDIFFWTLCSYCLARYLQQEERRWLLWFGTAIGLGLLNKYLLLFLGAALSAGLLLTPHRRLFREKYLFFAAGIALLIWLPNLIWQVANHFPVALHMRALKENQLVHVSPGSFLMDQVLSHLPAFFLIPAGLFFFFSKTGEKFRLLGWVFVFSELLLLFFQGKSYYALGLYPFLLAAGAVFLEKKTTASVWGMGFRCVSAGFPVILGLALFPFSIPCLTPEKMVQFCAGFVQKTGIDAPVKWEDGETHDLPQDYADMLGWKEIAAFTEAAWKQSSDQEHTLIYAENYGQAGAISWYGRKQNLPPVLSFSDTYLLWAPDSLDREITHFIYVNDELGEDVQQLFADIRLVGTIENPRARERGTRVYICKAPRESFRNFYKSRIGGIKEQLTGAQ